MKENKTYGGKRFAFWLIITAPLIASLFVNLFLIPAPFEHWNFSGTGEIGDTIGGIAGPILNFIGLILVYLTFNEQNRANEITRNQLKNQDKQNTHVRNFQLISKLISDYKEVLNKIENFSNISSAFENVVSTMEPEFKNLGQDLGMYYEEDGTLSSPEPHFHEYRRIFLGKLLRKSKDLRNYFYSLQIAESIVEKLQNLSLNQDEQSYLKDNFAIYFKSVNFQVDQQIIDSINKGLYNFKDEFGSTYQLSPTDDRVQNVFFKNDILVKLNVINNTLN